MAWLSAFKGLKKLGVPPVLVVALLAGFFVYTQVKGDGQTEPTPAAA